LVRGAAVVLVVAIAILIGLAGFPAQAGYLLAVLMVALLLQWLIGNIILRGNGERGAGQ
jgi:hypothetical protein